jgi:hypothetical protein
VVSIFFILDDEVAGDPFPVGTSRNADRCVFDSGVEAIRFDGLHERFPDNFRGIATVPGLRALLQRGDVSYGTPPA